MNLKDQLISTGRTRWLDVGCGDRFEDGFYYLDLFPLENIPEDVRNRYFNLNIVDLSREAVKSLGRFDFIRLQHVFEHLTWEEGKKCLNNCARIMKDGAYILVTVPDLRIHIDKYLKNAYPDLKQFSNWARRRIPENAPASFYFSIFAYSLSHEPHQWCYDLEGLLYQFEESKKFKDIRELKFSDLLAVEPFTHNRVKEDLCVIATKKKNLLGF